MQDSDLEQPTGSLDKFVWEVIDFDTEHIWLQVSFENPENIGNFD